MLFCCEEAKCKFSKFHRRRRLESDLKTVDVILQQTKNEIFFLESKSSLENKKERNRQQTRSDIEPRKKLFFRSLKIVIYFVTQLSFVEREKIDYHFHCLILKTCYFIKKELYLSIPTTLVFQSSNFFSPFSLKKFNFTFSIIFPSIASCKVQITQKTTCVSFYFHSVQPTI